MMWPDDFLAEQAESQTGSAGRHCCPERSLQAKSPDPPPVTLPDMLSLVFLSSVKASLCIEHYECSLWILSLGESVICQGSQLISTCWRSHNLLDWH